MKTTQQHFCVAEDCMSLEGGVLYGFTGLDLIFFFLFQPVFIFSLLMVIGPSNINTKIFTLISKIFFFLMSGEGGWGANFLFRLFYIRDRTSILKYKCFHIIQKYSRY